MARFRIAAALTSVLGLLANTPALADTQARLWARCRGDDAGSQLRACTALIESRREAPVNLARAYFNRGRARADRSDYLGAIRDYDRALARDPDFPDAFNSRGVAFAAMGLGAKAIEDFDRAIAQDGNYAIAIFNRALALQSMGRIQEAAQGFQNAKEVGARLTIPKE